MKNHSWQVSNLELSKRLKELRVKQESLWWWAKNHLGNFYLCYKSRDYFIEVGNTAVGFHSEEYYSAFTVAELGEGLPFGIVSGKTRNKYACMLHFGTPFPCNWTNRDMWDVSNADTEANARAKMKIYLKENKL